ncbi:unnamed protein product [Ambrosiozyma monospora]|uniref:Unnamed protein product n=1 Tax=Ambrosiozyma monospora TaxID=43982 RepID=A0ACB5T7H5_AMBMO|nr:unnamed protein product [Ambrosiozyma monospora]
MTKFQSIMNDLPDELEFSIWTTIITANLVLSDLVSFVTKFSYNAMQLYDSEDPKLEKTVVPLTVPIREYVTGLKIRVDMTSLMKFYFLNKYTELEYLEARVPDINEVTSSDPIVRILKSFNGLLFKLPKLKILKLHGFAVSQKLFASLSDGLENLSMKDYFSFDLVAYGKRLVKFPTGIQVFKFESSNEIMYKCPVIANTKNLTSLHTVEISTNKVNFIMPSSMGPSRGFSEPFLKSLPDTVRTFKLKSTADAR